MYQDNKTVPVSSYLIAAAIGFASAAVGVAFWGFFAVGNPLLNWLVETLAEQGHRVLFLLAMLSIDLVLNFVLYVPFALLLSWVKPRGSWQLLWTAVVVLFLALQWQILTDIEALSALAKAPSYYAGLLVSILPFVLAFKFVELARPARRV